MLNIDRIREMSADELAGIIKICPCEEKGIECDHDSCSDCSGSGTGKATLASWCCWGSMGSTLALSSVHHWDSSGVCQLVEGFSRSQFAWKDDFSPVGIPISLQAFHIT